MDTPQTNVTRSRGTVMVMIVVVLVLMAMLGAAYLQMARVQRVAPSQPINNIDLVLQSIIDEIKRQMEEDVRHDGTNFFVNGTAAEPHDYPYTNTATNKDVATLTVPIANGARGGINDDTWLGDAFPYLNGGTLTWRKLTSLTGGHYAANGNNVANGADGANPTLFVTTAYDDISVNDTNLADASGNGIGDSRWERAPLMVLTGAQYFMAVHIQDLSALINLRAGTALTDDGSNIPALPGTPTAADYVARGYVPNDADLTRLVSRHDASSWATGVGGAKTELGSLFANLALRNNAVPSTFPTAPAQRFTLWLDGGSPPDGTSVYGVLSIYSDKILPLQWRGGLHDPSQSNPYQTLLANVLSEPYDNTSATPIANPIDHYLGGTVVPVSGRTFPSIRHMITPISGRAAFAPNHGDMHGGAHTLQQDLVFQNAGNPQARAAAFQTRLERVFNRAPGYSGDPVLASKEFALAVQAYMDPSNVINTSFAHSGSNYYPIKRLPFLREAYMEVAYTDEDKYDSLNAENPDGDYDTWVVKPSSHGMVVEVGNPFDQTITAADLNNRIQVVIVQGGGDVATYTFTGASNLQSRHKLILVSNASTPTAETGATGNLENDLFATPGSNFTVTDLGADTLTFNANGTPVTVELRVDIGGTWVTYDRLTEANFSFPAEVSHAINVTQAASETTGQASVHRDGRTVRYLTNADRTIAKRSPPNDTSVATAYSTTECKIGEDNKVTALSDPVAPPAVPTHPLDRFQIPIANRQMFSVSEMGQVIMFGFSNASDGDFPQRLDTFPASGRFLDFSSGAPEFADGNGRNIKFAAAVLDQFTTLSSRYDGVNNETGAADAGNTVEDQFIFGTMNINTAPLHLAVLASPLPTDLTSTQVVMEAVLSERLTRNGFTSIGELMEVAEVNDYSGNGSGSSLGTGDVADLYPAPEAVETGTATRYDTEATGEEWMHLMQFFPQVFSTRSDIYIAHILAKGYVSGDFAAGPVEQGRMIVVFSRDKLVGAGGGEVEVIAAFKY